MRYIISFLLTSTAALAEVPTVVTDIPPVQALVAAVMDGVGEPQLLLPKGASEHAYQLKPSQAAALAKADLVVWVGPDLTPWLGSALDIRPQGAPVLGLLAAKGTLQRDFGAGEAAGHDNHDHAGIDPHAWLDPDNARVWTRLLAETLSQLDPGNAATYAANADTALAAIDAAEAEAAALLAPVKDRPFVAFHDAYGYFTGRYGLALVGTVALGDASVPGARHLSDLRQMVQTGSVTCLFPEVQHDPALMAQMAEGTGVRIGAALDPVGTAADSGPGGYPALLTGMARTLADCLSGP